MRRSLLTLLLSLAVLAAGFAAGAQAMVVQNADGNLLGVRFLPGTAPSASMIQAPSPPQTCDPWLPSDLPQPTSGLCWNGGGVLHSSETFTLTWDPLRRYWASTRGYIQQFLRDVASDSGKLTNPYALSSQYQDGAGRAAYASTYGGGCIDYGGQGGYDCRFVNSSGSGPGRDYGPSGCAPTGGNRFTLQEDGSFAARPNDTCITDAQIRGEVSAMAGLITARSTAGTPVVVVLTPPNVQVCLDAKATACSASADPKDFPDKAASRFCSYHGQVGGVVYVVQPWTAGGSACDEPDAPAIPDSPPPPPDVLARSLGADLVSPLSQSQLAAVVNPALNGWTATNGTEISDWTNGSPAGAPGSIGCRPQGQGRDASTIAGTSYLIQREFNNAAAIESDANAPGCMNGVLLSPQFVSPSQVNPGDLVQFDGSSTASTLIVPRAGYAWNFGDGTTAVGPSVSHVYATSGVYTVTLKVTDRGGNQAVLAQTVTAGNPLIAPPAPAPKPKLKVRLQLLPQALPALLRRGLALQVASSETADGIITLSIPAGAARRAHLPAGRAGSVTIARGTVAGIHSGRVTLRVRVARPVAVRLARLRHLTISVRLSLTAAPTDRLAVDVAGRY